MIENTSTDEQLCSLICFFVSAFLDIYQNIYSFITLKKKEIELNELESSNTPSEMTSYAHKHVFLYLHTQTNINTLLY